MKRLVKSPAQRLSEEKVRKLYALVEETIGNNDWFLSNCEKWHRLIHQSKKEISGENLDKNDPRVYVNFPWAFIRSTAPNIFFRDPYLAARPNQPGREQSAEVWEQLLNATLARTGFKQATKQVVLDALYYGEGWKKWLYSDATSTGELTGAEELGSTAEGVGLEATATEVPDQGPLSWDTINAPVGVRLSPMNVFPDDQHRKLEDSRYVIVRYRKYVDDLIADDNYPNVNENFRSLVENKNVPMRNRPSRAMEPTIGDEEDRDDPSVWVYEVWINQLTDLNIYKSLAVFVEHLEGKLARPLVPWRNLYGEHLATFPFTKLELIPVPDGPASSPLESWAHLNKTLSTVVNRIVSMANHLNLKYRMSKEGLQDPSAAEAKLMSDRAIEIIQYNSPSVADKIAPVDQPRIPSDLWQLTPMLMSLQTQVSGMSQNQRGGAGVRTATEAAVIDRNLQMRTDAMVDQVEEFIKADAEVMIQMIRAVVTSDFVFRRVGDTGGVKWERFTADDSGWSPDVMIEPASFRKAEFNEEAQRYLQALSVGGQLAQMYPVRLDLIYNRFLKRLEIPEADKILGDPVDASTYQLEEIIAMMVGAPAQVQPQDNHKVHAQTIESIMSTAAWGSFPPDVRLMITQHYETHMQMLQQQGEMAPNISMTAGLPTLNTVNYGGPSENTGPEVASFTQNQLG